MGVRLCPRVEGLLTLKHFGIVYLICEVSGLFVVSFPDCEVNKLFEGFCPIMGGVELCGHISPTCAVSELFCISLPTWLEVLWVV